MRLRIPPLCHAAGLAHVRLFMQEVHRLERTLLLDYRMSRPLAIECDRDVFRLCRDACDTFGGGPCNGHVLRCLALKRDAIRAPKCRTEMQFLITAMVRTCGHSVRAMLQCVHFRIDRCSAASCDATCVGLSRCKTSFVFCMRMHFAVVAGHTLTSWFAISRMPQTTSSRCNRLMRTVMCRSAWRCRLWSMPRRLHRHCHHHRQARPHRKHVHRQSQSWHPSLRLRNRLHIQTIQWMTLICLLMSHLRTQQVRLRRGALTTLQGLQPCCERTLLARFTRLAAVLIKPVPHRSGGRRALRLAWLLRCRPCAALVQQRGPRSKWTTCKKSTKCSNARTTDVIMEMKLSGYEAAHECTAPGRCATPGMHGLTSAIASTKLSARGRP